MSTGPQDADTATSTMPCPHCEAQVPTGAFCGQCGAHLAHPRGSRHWLRIGTYAAASHEHVLLPTLTSSLFPHLPHRSRLAFRVGLATLLLVLIVSAALRWQAPVIAIGSLGLPLLFFVYVYEAGVHEHLRLRMLVPTLIAGVSLGVAWALLTGRIVARSTNRALGSGLLPSRLLLDGFAIPVASAALMLIPVMLAWRWRLPTRKPLDGFIIGALGAISFTAAGTLTRLAPQFATGQIAHGRPIGGLLVEATIQGVAMPLTAAAAGGLVGTALWFTPRFPWPSRRWLVPVAVVVLIAYAALGITDVSGYPEMVQAAVELVVALLVVLALRIGLHMALLHHAHGPSPGAPLVCPECAKVLPELPFCPDCGVASQPAPLRYTSHARLAAGLAVGLAPVVAAAVVVTWILTPSARVYVCPPDCGEPPTGMPIQTNPRFTAGDGGFSVSYPGKAMFYSSVLENDGVVLDLHAGDGGTLQLMGQPAAARDPRQIAAELIKKTYPDATMDYELPNAMVGYQPGYGEIDDVYPEDVEGTYTRLRVLVLVAVKNGLALIAAAVGPYHEFTPDFGTGSPSGANLELALDIGKYVNSFRWRGDPPR